MRHAEIIRESLGDVVREKWESGDSAEVGREKIRRTRHFCGRAHVSRYVERWISSPSAAVGAVDGAAGSEPQKPGHPLALAQSVLDAEDGAMAAKLVANYG